MSQGDRLRGIDSSFLYAESATAHMHVASLAFFEDPELSEQSILNHVEDRLHLIPRYRQKIAMVPGNMGRPVWIDDTRFDIRNHVLFTGPGASSDGDVLRLTSRLLSRPLDRSRPLWEIWLMKLSDGRIALVTKSHHCLVDGISAVDIGTALMDFQPEPPPSTPAPRWVPEPEPSRARLLYDALRERAAQPARLADALRDIARDPQDFLARGKEVARGVLSFSKAGLAPAPRVSFTRAIGPHRRFTVVRSDLATIKAIRGQFGCTVNDVLLAAVAGGLRKLLQSRKESVDDLVLRAMVPVSFRTDAQRHTFGNQVSWVVANLPVGEDCPEERLRRTHACMTRLKESKQALGADFWFKLAELAPPSVLSIAGRTLPFQRMVNLIVTNIPGPQFPVYFQGAEMLEAFPVVPIGGVASLGVAVLSYNGKVTFGLNADYRLFPDLEGLAAAISESLDELRSRTAIEDAASAPDATFFATAAVDRAVAS